VVLLALVTVVLLTGPVVAAAQVVPAPVMPPPTGDASVFAPCAALPWWERPGCEVGQGVQSGVGSIVSAGVGGVFDQLYGWVAGGASWLLTRLVSLLDSTTRTDVTTAWFARQYRLMGALAAALVVPLLLISTLSAVVRQEWRGLTRSYLVYLPAAMLGTAVAVPLVDLALRITDWMGALFLDATRGDVTAFADSVAAALSSGATVSPAGVGGVAPFLLFVGAAIIALGAFAVWVELVLRTAGIYVALFFLPLGFAALVWPSTRAWFTRLVKALAALILSKFVIVAVIALAAAALGDISGPDSSGFNGVLAGAALMLMAAFSPLVLFRLADVAGDDMASAFGGVTQQRTSPVPTPSAAQSAATVYGRIMHTRVTQRPSTATAAGGAAAAGAGVATGGAALLVGAGAAAVTAPARLGHAAAQRLDHTTNTAPASTGRPPLVHDGQSSHRPKPTEAESMRDLDLARANAMAAGPPSQAATTRPRPPTDGPFAAPPGSHPIREGQ
jgi:hypothetical protein